jgi:hypothetical protein
MLGSMPIRLTQVTKENKPRGITLCAKNFNGVSDALVSLKDDLGPHLTYTMFLLRIYIHHNDEKKMYTKDECVGMKSVWEQKCEEQRLFGL